MGGNQSPSSFYTGPPIGEGAIFGSPYDYDESWFDLNSNPGLSPWGLSDPGQFGVLFDPFWTGDPFIGPGGGRVNPPGYTNPLGFPPLPSGNILLSPGEGSALEASQYVSLEDIWSPEQVASAPFAQIFGPDHAYTFDNTGTEEIEGTFGDLYPHWTNFTPTQMNAEGTAILHGSGRNVYLGVDSSGNPLRLDPYLSGVAYQDQVFPGGAVYGSGQEFGLDPAASGMGLGMPGFLPGSDPYQTVEDWRQHTLDPYDGVVDIGLGGFEIDPLSFTGTESSLLYHPVVPEGFSWQNYLGANPDLVSAGLDTPVEAYAHYINFGQNEAWRSIGELNPDSTFLRGGSDVEIPEYMGSTLENPHATSAWAQIYGGRTPGTGDMPLWLAGGSYLDEYGGGGELMSSFGLADLGSSVVTPVGLDEDTHWSPSHSDVSGVNFGGFLPASNIFQSNIVAPAYQQIYEEGTFPTGWTSGLLPLPLFPNPEDFPLLDLTEHPASGKPLGQLTASELADLNSIIGTPGTYGEFDRELTQSEIDQGLTPSSLITADMLLSLNVPSEEDPGVAFPSLSSLQEWAEYGSTQSTTSNWDPVITVESDPLGSSDLRSQYTAARNEYAAGNMSEADFMAATEAFVESQLIAPRTGVTSGELPPDLSSGLYASNIQASPQQTLYSGGLGGGMVDPTSVVSSGPALSPTSFGLTGLGSIGGITPEFFSASFGDSGTPSLTDPASSDSILELLRTDPANLGQWDIPLQPDPTDRYSLGWGPYFPPSPTFLSPDPETGELSIQQIVPAQGSSGKAVFGEGIGTNIFGSDNPFIGGADGGVMDGSPQYSSREPSSDLIDMTVSALRGEVEDPRSVISEFVKEYGAEALELLADDIVSGGDGSFMRGPGDGRADDVPGLIDGEMPVNLSSGEYVVPADVVKNLGGGSTENGAGTLMSMVDEIRSMTNGRNGGTLPA